MPRLPLLAFFLLLPSLSFGDGKTLAEPVQFLSREAYDQEAKARIASFKHPGEINISLFADASQTQNPSAICFDPSGRLYVAELHRWRAGVQDIRYEQRLLLDDLASQSTADRLAMYERDQVHRPLSFYTEFTDRIVVLEDTDHDGRADRSSVFADGFNKVLDGPGIGLLTDEEGSVYYTNIPHLWKLRDSDGNGSADQRISLQDGFGVRISISGHDMHGLVWGPDGKIYWSIGDRGYSFVTKEGRSYHNPYRGAVFRCDPDGSNVEEFYTGLRNPQELAFDAFGNLFTCDNNADSWDTGRLVYLMEGGDSGWHHGHQVLMNFRDVLGLRTPDYTHPGHKPVPLNAWTAESLWEPRPAPRPEFALPPIEKVSWGPSGLVYNYGVTRLPERYANHFFVCNFGGAKGDLEAFSVKEEGASFALDHQEVFMTGLGNTDAEFGPDGKLYLSCFNNNGWVKQDIGNIYTLYNTPTPEAEALLRETHALLTQPFSKQDSPSLAKLLGHSDMRVRQRAQFELVRRKERAILEAALQQKENRFQRLHGLWGIGQLARQDSALLNIPIDHLSDPDPEIRAHSATILGESRDPAMGEHLAKALSDPSSRVKAFAAIAIGKCGDLASAHRLMALLDENADQDVFLRHAYIQGLWYLHDSEGMLKELKIGSPHVRLGILLTLRKLGDPRVKYFLNDSEEKIRNEAIRAIYDLDLPTAMPDLAEHILTFVDGSEAVSSPVDPQTLMLQMRLINANYRVGKEENATHLLRYAAQEKLPTELRKQALQAVLEWREPTPVDPVTGLYRPLSVEDRDDISKLVASHLPDLFQSKDDELRGLATRVALAWQAPAPIEILTNLLLDSQAPTEARISSLEGLVRQNPAHLTSLWDPLLSQDDADLRFAVVTALTQIDAKRGTAAALDMARSDKFRLRQKGYRLLGASKAPEATKFLQDRVSSLVQEPAETQLDLLDAAALSQDGAIRKQLDDYAKSLDTTNPLAAFLVARQGGDPIAGKQIFLTNAAVQCSKCHKVDGDGGIAGPDLSSVGSQRDRDYLLQALIDPNSMIAPGYGITLVTLKDGSILGGILLQEDEKQITLKLPEPDPATAKDERSIPLTEIAERNPPVSAMPPMGSLLQKSEIRDVIAYLSSLGKNSAKKAH